jgi:hypothetical protein
MSDEQDDDGVPWASPEIQQNYEVALGRFVLAFNELDNLLGKLIKTVLMRLGRQDLVEDCVIRAGFGLRVRFLDLLKHSTQGEGLTRVPIASLGAIAQERNILVHGHFDQNPFDGSYRIIARRKTPFYSPERIDGLTEQATTAGGTLRSAEVFYAFSSDDEPKG